MKQPDRFERIVLKKCYPDMSVDKDEAINLLRREHAWFRRSIMKEKRALTLLAFKTRQSNDPRDLAIADCLYSRVTLCEELLSQLAQRRK